MNRFEGNDRLHALVDNEADADLKAELGLLLAVDPVLNARFDEHRRNKVALADAADVLSASSAANSRTNQLALKLWFAVWGAAAWRSVPQALAACALIGIGAFGHALYVAREEALEPAYAFQTTDQRLVLDAGNLRTARKLEAKSPASVSREAARWLGRAVDPPRLSEKGLALIDARLMQVDGRKLVGLVYEDEKGQRLTLSIGADPDGKPDELKTVDIEGGRADYWSDGRGSYVLVDERVDAPADAVEAVVEAAG